MQINKITSYSQNKQTSFKAVNQKYFEWAKKCYRLEENVSCDWLDNISFDVFLFKNLSRQDALDTIEAVKKYMNKTTIGLEETIKYLKNPY